MKFLSLVFVLVGFLIFPYQLQGANLYIRLTPTTIQKQSRAFTITVNSFKDAKKGEYLRFNVKVKAKPGESPLSPILVTELEVFDGEAVISSSLLQGTERDGEILYSFLVAAKYTEKSKFTFGEIACTEDGEPLPAANHYWFYLKDFS